jgi:hypothetical protein
MNITIDNKSLTKLVEDYVHSRLHDPSAKLKVRFEANTLGVTVHVAVSETKPKTVEHNYA